MIYSLFQQTPFECVNDLKDLIEDKVVYDIGAGDGEFGKVMANLFAKKVVLIENDPTIKLKPADMPNVEYILDDFMKVDLSKAEVIYIFMSFIGNYNLTRKLKAAHWHGTVISALYPMYENIADSWLPDKIIHSKDLPFLIYNL